MLWRKLFTAKLGIILHVVGFIWLFTPINRPFLNWSAARHDKVAEQEFKKDCPDYPAASVSPGSNIADECGMTLFGRPGPEYAATRWAALVVGLSGVVLLAGAGLRRLY